MRTLGFFLILFFSLQLASSQDLKPYTIGVVTTENILDIKNKVVDKLSQNGIKVIGQYQPAKDDNRWVIIITSAELINAVQKIGGLTGFAASLRVGITSENGKTIVSYTNPVYWGNAYFRESFDEVSSNYNTITTQLENAIKAIGSFDGTPFGSEKGLTIKDLRKYRYMLGMPRFDDTVELAGFKSYEAAIDKIESSVKNGVPDLKLVYKLVIPNDNLSLYGFALSGDDGERKFLPTIDIGNPKHTAFLPYEILVMGSKVYMLHGRYRIALSFPDLTMGTFSKIMSTPGDIKNSFKQLVE